MLKLVRCLVIFLSFIWISSLSRSSVLPQQCGSQVGGALCSRNLCCSQYGYCGISSAYCGVGCQSGPCTSGTGDISSIISRDMFEQLLKHMNDAACPAKGFYTYDAFIAAANSFSGFGTTGDLATRSEKPTPPAVVDRIGFYKRYCEIQTVGYGNNLECTYQQPFP